MPKPTPILAVLAAVLIAGSAAAQPAPEAGASAVAPAECVRPAAPAAIDGSTATIEQLQANKGEAAAFIAASDVYQTCIIDDLTAQKAAAKAAKTKFDKAAIKAADAKIAANQADKVAVGEAYNAAARAYRAAHPS